MNSFCANNFLARPKQSASASELTTSIVGTVSLFRKNSSKLSRSSTVLSTISSVISSTIFTTALPVLAILATLTATTSVSSENTYALSYESNVDIGFFVDDTIKISVTNDSGDTASALSIPELMPGASAESNLINIKVSTNTEGYKLSARMKTTSTDLTADGSTTSKFTSLPANDVPAGVTTDVATLPNDTWGYTSKTGSGNWTNYSGLPGLNSTEKLIAQRDTNGEETTQFKIGARASSEMSSKTYSNTIVFHAVASVPSEITVTWDANGGTVSSATSKIDYGTTVAGLGTLPTPTRNGFKFLGWFTKAEGGKEITASTKIIRNKRYYAHWGEATFDDVFADHGFDMILNISFQRSCPEIGIIAVFDDGIFCGIRQFKPDFFIIQALL